MNDLHAFGSEKLLLSYFLRFLIQLVKVFPLFTNFASSDSPMQTIVRQKYFRQQLGY